MSTSILSTTEWNGYPPPFRLDASSSAVQEVGPPGLEPGTNGLKARSDESEEEGKTPEID